MDTFGHKGSSARLAIIINPVAGKVRGIGLDTLTARVQQAVGPAEVLLTSRAGQASEMARRLLDRGCEQIVAVGGDGTVSEVVGGFLDSQGKAICPEARLGVVMCGTGNDFRRSISGSSSLDQDLQILARGRSRRIDLGTMTYVDHQGRPQQRVFNNFASFGISGEINLRVKRSALSPYLGGTGAFLAATVRSIISYRNKGVRLSLDDGPLASEVVRMVAVANGQYAGGNMRLAPLAEVDDGLFDVVEVLDFGTLEALASFPRVYKGTHLSLAKVRHRRARRVRAESDEEVLLDVDGEVPGRLPATFEIVPGVLRVIS